MPTLPDIRIEAIKQLHKKGINHTGYCKCPGTKIEYDLFEDNQNSPVKIKILCRKHKSCHRYPIGLRRELHNIVDYYVFFFEGESYYYLIPIKFLKQIFEKLDEPSINTQKQWFCNVRTNTHEFETKGVWWWDTSIGEYKVSTIEEKDQYNIKSKG